MEHLTPHHIPLYRTEQRRQQIWEQCMERNQPVVAIRDGTRGYIVRYDIQHLDSELDADALRELRERTRQFRRYPTGIDTLSETEGVGGEAGPISGDLHTESEQSARALAAQLSSVVFKNTL